MAQGRAIPAPGTVHPNGIPVHFDPGFLLQNGVFLTDGIPVQMGGNALPLAPEHTLHVGLAYTWFLAAGSVTARWDYQWQSHSFISVHNRGGPGRLSAFDQHNASLMFESADDRWALQAWIRNIENDMHATGGVHGGDLIRGWHLTEPRMFGLSVRYRFGDAAL